MNDPQWDRETMLRIATECNHVWMTILALDGKIGEDARVGAHVKQMWKEGWLEREMRTWSSKTGGQFTREEYSLNIAGRLEFGLE